MMLLSGGTLITVDWALSRYEGAVQKGDLFGEGEGEAAARSQKIQGPLNILLVGIDPRTQDEVPRADSVMIVHVPKGLDHAYLFSLPRDLLLAIPAFPKSGYAGAGSEKLAHAMAFGAQVRQGLPKAAQGFELLAAAVSDYTGLKRFDAGAIIDFGGFSRVIDALGGVDLRVDQVVRSLHMGPDGRERQPARVGYTGPQMIYRPGWQHFTGWQALDFARQRYVVGGDYARQQHQQQLLRAMIDRAFSGSVVTNPAQLDKVLRAAGASLIFSGRGIPLVEWAFALRNLRPHNLTLLHLAGASHMADGEYVGEQLDIAAFGFFDSLLDETVDGYVVQHPEMVGGSA